MIPTKQMDTLEAIRNRRSIRRYKNEVIPKDDLETIAEEKVIKGNSSLGEVLIRE